MRRILVIDDEPAMRDIVKTTLELVGGFEAMTSATGEDGVRAAITHRPDAILLDVMMPGMSGMTARTLLAEDDRTRDIPVVMLTAKVRPQERAALKDAGVAGVIPKPFDAMDLPRQLAALLGWDD